MTFTAKLYRNATDTFDISLGLRVTPGEGFDPFDAGIIDPQFSDNAIGEGAALLSTHYANREMQFPVHIQSSKYGYANTKDGLNSLLQRLSFLLQNAWRVEWADDSATKSTWFDVVSAKFEPDANFRRQQANWMSGIIRIWVRPFGHTATERVVGTAGASVPIVLVPSVGIAGDVPAMMDVKLSYGHPNGFFAGNSPTVPYSIITGWGVTSTGSYSGFMPAATLKARATVTMIDVIGAATLAGASGSAGSQAARVFLAYTPGNVRAFSQMVFSINRNELDYGRNRMLGMVRVPTIVGTGANSSVASVGLVLSNRQVAGPDTPEINEFISNNGPGLTAPTTTFWDQSTFQKWRVVDLGVINNGTGALESSNPIVDQLSFDIIGYPAAASGVITATIDFGGLVVFPEDQTVVSVDPVGASVANTALGFNASAVAATYEYLQTTNQFTRTIGPTDALRMIRSTDDMLRGAANQHFPPMPTAAIEQLDVQRLFGFALIDGGPQNGILRVETKARERFTYQR